MTDRNNTAGIGPIVPRTAAYTAFAKGLRLSVGRGCRFSYKELARKSGVSARMIEAYRYAPDHEEWRAAPFEDILSLSAALGPEFTADYLMLASQGAFWLPDTNTPPGILAADNSDDNARLTRAALDGEFQPHEKPALKVVGANMVSRGAALVAIANAA